MAHKKGEGSTQNGRDSNAKYLGVKLFGGQTARAGNVIIRQRGTKWHPGENVYLGKDFTVHAKVDGTVYFHKGRKGRTYVNIKPYDEVNETVAPTPTKVKPTKPEKVEIKVATTVKAAEPAPEAPKASEKPTAMAAAAEAPKAEEKAPEAPKAEKKAAAPVAEASEKDNLKKFVEGIGPKIESLLNEAGIFTFAQLAETDVEKIKEILAEAGSRYQMHDPTTWPQQAKLAAEGKFDELKEWQGQLDGGRA